MTPAQMFVVWETFMLTFTYTFLLGIKWIERAPKEYQHQDEEMRRRHRGVTAS